ncbi:hypothetical protein [Pseudomonas sp. RC3H12]|uniref:hypothetical protein n=1 Tax=Pseudomonas sp. RC3H12 TaxID=2834406 RepID=UPI001BDEF60B|nr:hypothetical protein [Pseudomonas sp. RC3H12]QWA31374.1 hypothetical protein KHO27_11030 [Pseudomonas sp. RC3H12]
MEYNRIIYPERAEYLSEQKFQSYKVFLSHWDPLSIKIKNNFEEAHLRRVSKTLIIYGAQSTGKTLLANKLSQDFNTTSTALQAGAFQHYDDANMWHRTVSGFSKDENLIAENTRTTALLHIEDDADWITKAKQFCGSNSGRTVLIIADNCERDYFIQGLLGITDLNFLQIGRTPTLIKSAAQRFVALCRTELRGAMLLMFTNDEGFAQSFEEAVNTQHQGLVEATAMPMPSPRDKETVIRVNTNRLNPFSYWYCLDRAGIDEKKNTFRTLTAGADGYKAAFESVDRAIQLAKPSRIGRPPKKCLITFFVLTDRDCVRDCVDLLGLGSYVRNVNSNSFLDVVTFTENWTSELSFGDQRSRKLLQSEWNLRIVVAGNPFVSALLSGTQRPLIKNLIDATLAYHGPGTHSTTVNKHMDSIDTEIELLTALTPNDNSSFWALGQIRSSKYEGELRCYLPGYSTGQPGFMNYLPDYSTAPYRPCELSASQTDTDSEINETIRRNAIACEFTSIKDLTALPLKAYLDKKLPNYVEIMQEQ